MSNITSDIERFQTRIEMIRTESRILSHKIERYNEQRKSLSEEKRNLKQLLTDALSISEKD